MIAGKYLIIHVIYRDPSDYPGMFVGRAQRVGPPGDAGWYLAAEPFAIARTLAEVRAALPPGETWIDRDPLDDPKIVEVWL